MSTRENVALERRVEDCEAAILSSDLVWIRTTLVVMDRGAEPRWRTAAEVFEASGDPPPLVEVERRADLEVLLHPISGTRLLRHDLWDQADLDEFDELAKLAKPVDVEIRCHAKQVEAILSRSPVLVLTGGNRAGKSRVLAWWLFRRWLLRGHSERLDERLGQIEAALFWWVAPSMAYAYQFGVQLLAGAEGKGGGVWPDEVFAALPGVHKAELSPTLRLIDGSVVAFKHAHHSGQAAGDNLVSANVTDAVIDELARIKDVANYQQIHSRVSQAGGSIASATTRKRGHWMREEIDQVAPTSGGAILVLHIDILDNPWMSFAAIGKLLVGDGTFTAVQLEQVLPANDIPAAVREQITRPRSMIEHLGLDAPDGSLLWTEWREDLIYPAVGTQSEIWVTRGGEPVRLLDITKHVLARHWPREAEEGRSYNKFVGADFNYHARAIVFQLFGLGRTVEEALANRKSWSALAIGEVDSSGSTLAQANKIRQQIGVAPVWVDPHGKKGDAARGTETTTDVAEFRAAGFPVAPANGIDATGRFHPIRRSDSANVVHHLHSERRLLVSSSCTGLIDAWRHDEHGKRSGTDSQSDLRSGYSDAAKYGLWPIFHADILGAGAA